MAEEFAAVCTLAHGPAKRAEKLLALQRVEAAAKACRVLCEPWAPAELKAGVEACLAAGTTPAGLYAGGPLARALGGFDLIPCKDLGALAHIVLSPRGGGDAPPPAACGRGVLDAEDAAKARVMPRGGAAESLVLRLEARGVLDTKEWKLAVYRVGARLFASSEAALPALSEDDSLLEVWADAGGWAVSAVQPLGFLACPPDSPPRRTYCPVAGVPCKKWDAAAKAYL